MKPAKRKSSKQVARVRHEPAFREIIGLIAAARRRAFQAVNTELIDLYWHVTLTFVALVVRQIQPTTKTLATAETIELDARPHPGPLPQERENCSPAFNVVKVLGGSFAFCFDSPRRGDMQVDSQKIYGDHWLFPLLGGEGQGEGGREHKLFQCLP